jgi:hypothetical protein
MSSSVSIVSGRGERIYPLTSVSRPTLGPTQPPVKSVPVVLSPGVKRGRGVTVTTHPHPVPKSRMNRRYTSSPPKRLVAGTGTALALSSDENIFILSFLLPQYLPRYLQ